MALMACWRQSCLIDHSYSESAFRAELSAAEQGRINNHRVVAPSAAFHWPRAWGGTEVFVTGDFAAWSVRP